MFTIRENTFVCILGLDKSTANGSLDSSSDFFDISFVRLGEITLFFDSVEECNDNTLSLFLEYLKEDGRMVEAPDSFDLYLGLSFEGVKIQPVEFTKAVREFYKDYWRLSLWQLSSVRPFYRADGIRKAITTEIDKKAEGNVILWDDFVSIVSELHAKMTL